MARIIKLKQQPLLWLGFLFTGLALLQLTLVRGEFDGLLPVSLLVLMLCGGSSVYFLQIRRPPGDPILLPLVFFLSGLGLVLVTRLAPAFVSRQLIWLVIATILLLVVSLLPRNLSWLRRYKYSWLIGGLILLAATLVLGVNPSGFGARLWLQFGTVFFQPSEPLKLLLVIFLAAYLADRRHQLIEIKAYIGPVPFPHPSYFGPMFLMWAFSIILLIWQRDLGAALLFFGTFVGMLYAATGERRYILAGALLLIGAGVIGTYLFDVVQLRVEAFWNPWLDPAGRSFQIVQSLLAFAAGGFFGQGLGQGLPTAIPVVHTDFVFAAIGEEYGLLGALGVLTCFALLVSRAFYIGLRARNGFEQLLAVGIGVVLSLQTLVITAGTLKLMPLTGVTLPFVSYGGSSLVTSFLMIGLLLFIAQQTAGQPASFLAPPGVGLQNPVISPPAKLETPPTVRHQRLAAKGPPASERNPKYNLAPYLHLAWGLLVGFLIVAGGLIFWQIALAPFLVTRDDNPRPIIVEQTTRRGRLITADGIPIAETTISEAGLAQRHYPYPGLASVTGYYSIRYGVGGTEASFDSLLRGTLDRSETQVWLDDLLHQPALGQDVTLTIDLPAQVAADVALDQREGAVVVMDLATGGILVMSSHPTYDPNTLDETWGSLREDASAPLLNRASQGLFPVGELARLIGLLGLVEARAQLPSNVQTAPLEAMLAPLGEAGYLATAHQLGLARSLEGIRSQPGLLPGFDNKGTVRDLAVTPLHMARLMAALELAGQLPTPILSLNQAGTPLKQAIRPDTSQAGRSLLTQVDEQMIGMTGLATPQETGKGYLSWFVGLAPTSASPETLSRAQPAILNFDPTKITPTPPSTATTDVVQPDKARYVVVVVAVIADETERNVAFRIARAPIQTILEQEAAQ